MSKCRIQWPVEWLGQKSHTYIGFRNNRHLASTGEHTVVVVNFDDFDSEKNPFEYSFNTVQFKTAKKKKNDLPY